jgi:2'-5' RNA ligase
VERDGSSGPEAKPLRLFVAVDVPEGVAARLGEAIEPFRTRIPGARWTRREGWHVTLKFLGATRPGLVPQVEAAVRTVASASTPFDTRLTGIGAFPSANRARVLWAGLDDAAGSFGPMVKQLDELLAADFVAEKRPFTPHLTVARIDPPRRLSEFAPRILDAELASDTFAVDRLVLYRSRLSPKGATYEALLAAPLGA